MTTEVTIDRAAGTFRMARCAWSMVKPLDQLAVWLAFYRGLKARGDKGLDGRVWGHAYAEDVAALEVAVKELRNG